MVAEQMEMVKSPSQYRYFERLKPKVTKAQYKVLGDFRSFLLATKREPKTIDRHFYCLGKFLEAAGSNFDFYKATRPELQNIVGLINSSTLALETKRKIVVSVKLLYKNILGEGVFYPPQIAWLKTKEDIKEKHMLPGDLLTEDEVLKMIDTANNDRDRAIIALLYDAGIRVGELVSLNIKHVEFDNELTHITVNGKTGMRRIPILFSVPYLTKYLEHRKDAHPEDPLWITFGVPGTPSKKTKADPETLEKFKRIRYKLRVGDYIVRKVIKDLVKKAKIQKRVYPHLFRHSRATYYADKATEQVLKSYFGWVGDSKMAGTYVHLSGRDVDSAILQANGIKPQEKAESRPVNKRCIRCKEINPITSVHCSKCALALDTNIAELEDKGDKLVAKVVANPVYLDTLIKMLKEMQKQAKT